MNGASNHLWLIVALVGALTVLSMLVRQLFHRLGIPPLVGYLLIGMTLAQAQYQSPFLGVNAHHVFEFLGGIGIFCLLFRIGLESKTGEPHPAACTGQAVPPICAPSRT
jgi:Kef-type K+ transport system membrane component KefB